MKKIIFGLLIGSALTVSAYAENPVNRRQANQRDRIRQGVRSGELTRVEARHLAVKEAQIRLTEAKVKADGEVTAKEARKLDHQLDRASHAIYHQKHDRQDRN